MGCPGIYYKKALQRLASYLATIEDECKLACELQSEQSNEKLEKYILDRKTKIDWKLFFLYAGHASGHVLDDAFQEGNDATHAAWAGINDFEHFIGLLNDEED